MKLKWQVFVALCILKQLNSILDPWLGENDIKKISPMNGILLKCFMASNECKGKTTEVAQIKKTRFVPGFLFRSTESIPVVVRLKGSLNLNANIFCLCVGKLV
jgi:hypothetical protein